MDSTKSHEVTGVSIAESSQNTEMSETLSLLSDEDDFTVIGSEDSGFFELPYQNAAWIHDVDQDSEEDVETPPPPAPQAKDQQSNGNVQRKKMRATTRHRRLLMVSLVPAMEFLLVMSISLIWHQAQYRVGELQPLGYPSAEWLDTVPAICLDFSHGKLAAAGDAGLTKHLGTDSHSIPKADLCRRKIGQLSQKELEEYVKTCGDPEIDFGELYEHWVTLTKGLQEGELLSGFTHHYDNTFEIRRARQVRLPEPWRPF